MCFIILKNIYKLLNGLGAVLSSGLVLCFGFFSKLWVDYFSEKKIYFLKQASFFSSCCGVRINIELENFSRNVFFRLYMRDPVLM